MLGNLEGAKSLLSECLETFDSNAVALLRMGYVLLCQDQHDHAAQFLQKCVLQPQGTLTYGISQKGAAHLYLCIALHLRTADRTSSLDSTKPRGGEEAPAEEQFRKGYELLPHIPREALASLLA